MRPQYKGQGKTMPYQVSQTRGVALAVVTCSFLVISACSSGANDEVVEQHPDDRNQASEQQPVSEYDPRPNFVKRGCSPTTVSPQQFCPEDRQ